MSLTSYFFMAEEAGKNIKRNGLMSIAALTTVTIALTVLGAALCFFYTLNQAAASLPAQYIVAVFEKPDISREQTLEVQKRIEAMPEVKWVKLVTKEQAWATFQEDDKKDSTSIAGSLDTNPLPDAFDVMPRDPKQTGAICAALTNTGLFPEVDRVRDDRKTLSQILATSRLITNVGIVATIVLFIATGFVIQNTIRLTVYARRRDIRIMQLVGATPGFIRLPLILEGIFYGVVGAVVASGMLVFAGRQLGHYVTTLSSPITHLAAPSITPVQVVGSLTAIGVFVGCTGSILSIRRFLKKI